MEPESVAESLTGIDSWDGWFKEYNKFGETDSVDALRDGNRRMRNLLELQQEMYTLALEQCDPDLPGFGLEYGDMVQLLGTAEDYGRTFSFIVTDRNITLGSDGEPPTLDDWAQNLSIRVLPVGEKARITPLAYHANPLENQLERLDAEVKDLTAQVAAYRTEAAYGIGPLDASLKQTTKDHTRAETATGGCLAADAVLSTAMDAMIHEVKEMNLTEEKQNSLFKTLLDDPDIGKLVAEGPNGPQLVFEGVHKILKRTADTDSAEPNPGGIDGAGVTDGLKTARRDVIAATKDVIAKSTDATVSYGSCWGARSKAETLASRKRKLEGDIAAAKARAKELPKTVARLKALLDEKTKERDDLEAEVEKLDDKEKEKWRERRSFLITIDAADLKNVHQLKIIVERPPHIKIDIPDRCVDFVPEGGKIASRRVFRIPVYRGICRTRIVIVPDDEVRRRFGRLFSETFIAARVDISNPGDAPIEVYSSSMWVKVTMAAERSKFVKHGSGKDAWYEARQRDNKSKNGPDDYASEWRIFYTKFRPYTFRDVLAMFEADRRRSWQQTTVDLMKYGGTLAAGAGIFTTDINYLEGVNFFNGIFRPATEELLMRELMARLSDLERSSFHDIEPIAAHSREDRLVFFPKNFIANMAGVIIGSERERHGLFSRKVTRPMPALARIIEIKPTWVYVSGRRILQADAVESAEQ